MIQISILKYNNNIICLTIETFCKVKGLIPILGVEETTAAYFLKN